MLTEEPTLPSPLSPLVTDPVDASEHVQRISQRNTRSAQNHLLVVGCEPEDPAGLHAVFAQIKSCQRNGIPVTIAFSIDSSTRILRNLANQSITRTERVTTAHLERIKKHFKSDVLLSEALPPESEEAFSVLLTELEAQTPPENKATVWDFRFYKVHKFLLILLDYIKDSQIPIVQLLMPDISSVINGTPPAYSPEKPPLLANPLSTSQCEEIGQILAKQLKNMQMQGSLLIVLCARAYVSNIMANTAQNLQIVNDQVIRGWKINSFYMGKIIATRDEKTGAVASTDYQVGYTNHHKPEEYTLVGAGQHLSSSSFEDAVNRMTCSCFVPLQFWLKKTTSAQQDIIYTSGGTLLLTQDEHTLYQIPNNGNSDNILTAFNLCATIIDPSATWTPEQISRIAPFVSIAPLADGGYQLVCLRSEWEFLKKQLKETSPEKIPPVLKPGAYFRNVYPTRTFWVDTNQKTSAALSKLMATIVCKTRDKTKITMPGADLTPSILKDLDLQLSIFYAPNIEFILRMRAHHPHVKIDYFPDEKGCACHIICPLSCLPELSTSFLRPDTIPHLPRNAFMRSVPRPDFWIRDLSEENRKLIVSLGGEVLKEAGFISQIRIDSERLDTDLCERLGLKSMYLPMQISIAQLEEFRKKHPFISMHVIPKNTGPNPLFVSDSVLRQSLATPKSQPSADNSESNELETRYPVSFSTAKADPTPVIHLLYPVDQIPNVATLVESLEPEETQRERASLRC